MLTPGPDHPITTEHNRHRVRANAAGHVIADSAEVVTLYEAGCRPVHYFPRKDVETGFLSETDKVTTCPYKGDAAHYTMLIDGELLENAAWSYRSPYPHMDAIRDRIAFYTDKVQVYVVDEEALERHKHGEAPPVDKV